MKKFFVAALFAVASLFAGIDSNAQSQFNKGDFALNLDYSLGQFQDRDFGWSSSSLSYTQHGVGILGEYGIMNVINSKGTISVGGQIGFGFGGDGGDNDGYNDFDLFRFRIATRGTLHYAFIPQIDTYAGLNFLFVDVNHWSSEYKDANGKKVKNSDSNVKFIEPRLVAGARYMFSSAFGVNMEFSWDRFAFLAAGLSFKF